MDAHGELPRTDPGDGALYATGVTCGLLAAIAAEILLSHAGFDLSGAWRNLISAQSLQLRSAGAWWLMAGSALVASALVVGVLSRLLPPWHRFRLLRWILGVVGVFALAEIGHLANEAGGQGGGAQLAVTLAALLAAAFMSVVGAYMASRRARTSGSGH